METIPPPPDDPAPPAARVREPAPPGPSSKVTILAIVAAVAVIAIIGVVLALLANSGGDEAGGSPSSSPSAVALAAPRDLNADPSAFDVVVTWTPGEGAAVTRYLVSRDGSVAATLGSGKTRWVDDDVLPETHYVYTVAAVGSDGTTAPARIATRTASAPLATARLQGTFNVHLHATSHFGFANFGSDNGNLGWRFTPTCSKDPCDTELADLHQKDFVVTLARSGASYHGSVTVHGQVKCGGTAVASSFTITIHLTDAGADSGKWVGTKVEGTMTQYESAQLGCVASGATYAVTGNLVS